MWRRQQQQRQQRPSVFITTQSCRSRNKRGGGGGGDSHFNSTISSPCFCLSEFPPVLLLTPIAPHRRLPWCTLRHDCVHCWICHDGRRVMDVTQARQQTVNTSDRSCWAEGSFTAGCFKGFHFYIISTISFDKCFNFPPFQLACEMWIYKQMHTHTHTHPHTQPQIISSSGTTDANLLYSSTVVLCTASIKPKTLSIKKQWTSRGRWAISFILILGLV